MPTVNSDAALAYEGVTTPDVNTSIVQPIFVRAGGGYNNRFFAASGTLLGIDIIVQVNNETPPLKMGYSDGAIVGKLPFGALCSADDTIDFVPNGKAFKGGAGERPVSGKLPHARGTPGFSFGPGDVFQDDGSSATGFYDWLQPTLFNPVGEMPVSDEGDNLAPDEVQAGSAQKGHILRAVVARSYNHPLGGSATNPADYPFKERRYVPGLYDANLQMFRTGVYDVFSTPAGGEVAVFLGYAGDGGLLGL